MVGNLFYLHKQMNNPNRHKCMLNVLQVKPPKIAFIVFELLLSQAVMKTNGKHGKLLICPPQPLTYLPISIFQKESWLIKVDLFEVFCWFYLIFVSTFSPEWPSHFHRIDIQTKHHQYKTKHKGGERDCDLNNSLQQKFCISLRSLIPPTVLIH